MLANHTIGKSPIKAMFLELAKADADLHAAKTDIEHIEAAERHWAVRERIAAAPTLNLRDAGWRARAAELERERDPDFTNDAPGSAAHLASLVVADVIRFAGPVE